VTEAFSTLLRQSGLRASTGGVLATKSEHACTRFMPGFICNQYGERLAI